MQTITLYCSEADMKRRFSTYGVLAFADHDEDGVSDTGVVADSITRATEEINLYTQAYNAASLAESNLINRWCTDLAVFFHCELRGNPVPESLVLEHDRIMAKLERVMAGTLPLPGIGKRSDLRPTFSNLTIDRRYRRSVIRVVKQTSSGVTTTQPQKTVQEIPVIYD